MLFFIGVFDSLKLFKIYRKTPRNLFFLFFQPLLIFFCQYLHTLGMLITPAVYIFNDIHRQRSGDGLKVQGLIFGKIYDVYFIYW